MKPNYEGVLAFVSHLCCVSASCVVFTLGVICSFFLLLIGINNALLYFGGVVVLLTICCVD